VILLLVVAFATFAADRLTKFLVQRNLEINVPHQVIDGVVYLTRTQNSGAAFSLGQRFGTFYLLFALAAAVFIVLFNRRVPDQDVFTRVALGMILGGALGNAFDRLVSSSVTDFIDLRWWPVFNVADSCIVVAALTLVVRFARGADGGGDTKRTEAEPYD
jgi:signal peptidase II